MPPRTLEAVTTCQKSIPKLKNSKSLRSTIPAIVVSMLELKRADRIRWVVDVPSGRVSVRKESI